MSEIPDRIFLVADLLMGAVHADGALEGREEAAVRRLLATLLGDAPLPKDLEARLVAFDPKGFDVKVVAAEFLSDSPARKRRLLELVAAVHDADEVFDCAEDDYLTSLGSALGMKHEEYADLTFAIEELREALTDVRKPVAPPVPEEARKSLKP